MPELAVSERQGVTEADIRTHTHCPRCGSKVGEVCRSEGGISRSSHAERRDAFLRNLRETHWTPVTTPEKVVTQAIRTGYARIRFAPWEQEEKLFDRWRKQLYESSRSWHRVIDHEFPTGDGAPWFMTITIDRERGVRRTRLLSAGNLPG
jgi:hypothetical protein